MNKIFLSTIDEKAHILAKRHGLGLEIAEFCTAWNMDEKWEATDAALRKKLRVAPAAVLHAPFNELFPCAIDPKARRLAADRYRQAIQLAKDYGAGKVVIHGGYNPQIYYPVWYVEQSVLFWKEFLREDPGVEIVLENVLEEEPGMLLNIIRAVDSPRLGLCLDVGHVNAYSMIPVTDWLEAWAPHLRHFHLHNNDGTADTHSPLPEGSIPVADLLTKAATLCPHATYTLELTDSEASLEWLKSNVILSDPEHSRGGVEGSTPLL